MGISVRADWGGTMRIGDLPAETMARIVHERTAVCTNGDRITLYPNDIIVRLSSVLWTPLKRLSNSCSDMNVSVIPLKKGETVELIQD